MGYDSTKVDSSKGVHDVTLGDAILYLLQSPPLKYRRILQRHLETVGLVSPAPAPGGAGAGASDSGSAVVPKLPCIAVHIRHGDACNQDYKIGGNLFRTCYPLDVYAKQIQVLLARYGNHLVYLSTDDPHITKATAQYPVSGLY
jgi:hypothetical protein